MGVNLKDIQLDKDSHEPLYRQLASRLKERVIRGDLKNGDQLPPGRALAADLDVHRTTVSNAYELLEEEGILHSHVGRGTFVLGEIGAYERKRENPEAEKNPMMWETLFASDLAEDRLHSLLNIYRTGSAPGKKVSFIYALPPANLFPVSEFKQCLNRALKKYGPVTLDVGDSAGFAPLLDYLVAQLPAGRAVTDDVVITNGCQQSISLIRKILVAPGDTVLVENPTYPGALSVFNEREIRCIGIPVTESGIDLNTLEKILTVQPAKLLYTIPNFQNPTGTTMPLLVRRRLLELSARFRLPIVEDDIYGDLRFAGKAIPSLKELDTNGSVIYLNGFSKTAFPGLRVGWVVANRTVIARLRTARQTMDLHTNVLAQAAMFEMLQSGMYDRHMKKIRKTYASKRNRTLNALKRHLPAEARWSEPEGGLSIWLTLPEGTDASSLLSLSAREGISFSPGGLFYLNGSPNNSLRLAFSMTDTSAIEEGIRKLGNVIRQLPAAIGPETRYSSTVLV